MKFKFILFSFVIFLCLATKCAEKTMDLTIENKSTKDIVLTIKHKNFVFNELSDSTNYYDKKFFILKRNESKSFGFSKYNFDYYLNKEKLFYTFYFYKVIKVQQLTNLVFVEKKYDSINFGLNNVKFGKNEKIRFVYEDKNIKIFK